MVVKRASSKESIDKEKLYKEMERKAFELYLKRKGRCGGLLDSCIEAVKSVNKKYDMN